MDASVQAPPKKSQCRRFRFSLRTLFLFLTAACAFAWLGNEAVQLHLQKSRVEAIRSAGGSVTLVPSDRFGTTVLNKLFGVEANSEVVRIDNFRYATDEDLESLAYLPTLQHLSITGAPITDLGLISIAKLPNLEWLTLSRTKITEAGLFRLAELKKLKHLDISDCKLSELGLSSISKIESLEELGFTRTEISDADLHRLADVKNLKVIGLSENNITGQGLSHLSPLKGLSDLTLQEKKITDEGFASVVTLENLKVLRFYNTQVTDLGFSNIARMKKLQALHLNSIDRNSAALADLRQKCPTLRIEQIYIAPAPGGPTPRTPPAAAVPPQPRTGT